MAEQEAINQERQQTFIRRLKVVDTISTWLMLAAAGAAYYVAININEGGKFDAHRTVEPNVQAALRENPNRSESILRDQYAYAATQAENGILTMCLLMMGCGVAVKLWASKNVKLATSGEMTPPTFGLQ